MLKKSRGFTLIELLVVISIIGILASIVVVGVNDARKKGRDARRVGDIRQIKSAMELYYNANKKYPVSAITVCDGGGHPIDSTSSPELVNQLVPTYLPALSADPLNGDGIHSYDYVCGPTDSATPQSYGLKVIFESKIFDTTTGTEENTTTNSCKTGVNLASYWWQAGYEDALIPNCPF